MCRVVVMHAPGGFLVHAPEMVLLVHAPEVVLGIIVHHLKQIMALSLNHIFSNTCAIFMDKSIHFDITDITMICASIFNDLLGRQQLHAYDHDSR